MATVEQIPEVPGVVEDTLLKALHGVQSETLKLTMDAEADVATKTGGKFKYRYLTLEKLMETIVPVLTRHGLVWVTLPCRDEHADPALRYELIHAESGEKIAETMPLMLTARDPQGLGSAVTYARRYSLLAVLGLAPDEDDDGQKASRPASVKAAKPSNGNGTSVNRLLNDAELVRMVKAVEESGNKMDLLLAAVGLEATDDVTLEHAQQIKKMIERTA